MVEGWRSASVPFLVTSIPVTFRVSHVDQSQRCGKCNSLSNVRPADRQTGARPPPSLPPPLSLPPLFSPSRKTLRYVYVRAEARIKIKGDETNFPGSLARIMEIDNSFFLFFFSILEKLVAGLIVFFFFFRKIVSSHFPFRVFTRKCRECR